MSPRDALHLLEFADAHLRGFARQDGGVSVSCDGGAPEILAHGDTFADALAIARRDYIARRARSRAPRDLTPRHRR